MDVEGNGFDISNPVFCCYSVGEGEDMAGDEVGLVS